MRRGIKVIWRGPIDWFVIFLISCLFWALVVFLFGTFAFGLAVGIGMSLSASIFWAFGFLQGADAAAPDNDLPIIY